MTSTIRALAATIAEAGAVDGRRLPPNSDCGTEFDRRYNPSNTGNIRVQSRFTLTDSSSSPSIPAIQYVKANGGGTVTAREGLLRHQSGRSRTARPICSTAAPSRDHRPASPAIFGGTPYFGGVDLNGDGDMLDQVTRARAQPDPDRPLRRDRRPALGHQRRSHGPRHLHLRSTPITARPARSACSTVDGEPFDVFPVNDPLADAARRRSSRSATASRTRS